MVCVIKHIPRALIEVSADKELKQEVTMAIPKREDVKEGHTLCPKKPHVAPVTSMVVPDDGFITVVSRRSKSKGAATSQKKPGGGFKVNSSKNFVYQPVKPKDKDAQPSTSGANVTRKESTKVGENNGIKLKNLFEKLNEINSIVDPNCDTGEGAMMNTSDVMGSQHNADSESEVEEVFAEEDPIKLRGKGASTPSADGFDV
ncbi:hypothetical protein Tco_0233069 [Tanacetum coccineum]